MIKILFFVETLSGGGAEKVLRTMIDHMDRSQFDITVQSVWPCEEGKRLAPGVRYRTVYPVRNKITERLYRAEAAAKIVYPLHIKDDYDIECAFLEYGPTKIISSSTNKKAKKLAWVHCDLSHALVEYVHTSYEAFAKKTRPWYKRFDRIICVSQSVKRSFDQIFDNAFQSVVLYNVVDDELIREKADADHPQLEKRRLTIVAVGTLYPPKNYPRLLRTHERLIQEGIDHDLWILGEGEQRPQIEQYIKEHGLAGSVTLLGFQQNPYPYMKAADVVVCSSDYEGFSTVITESTILGKAVVTTDCSGMREILGESEYGLITETSDTAFYDGLRVMLSDPLLRREYAQKAAIRGRSFSMEKLVSDVQCFLRKVAIE